MKFKTKASRQKGGLPWINPTDQLKAVIECVNELFEFRKNTNFDEPRIPDFPQLSEDGFPDELLETTYSADMKKLEIVLRNISTKTAIYILKRAPYWANEEEAEMVEMISNHDEPIFSPVISQNQCAINDFLFGMRCYESLVHFHTFLKQLTNEWNESKERIFRSFDLEKDKTKLINVYSRFPRWDEYIKIDVDYKGTIHLSFNEPMKHLVGVELDRIRICPKCEKVFWAGRKDMVGCIDCAAAIRNKRWRDNISDERKKLYNEARRKKRQKVKSQLNAQRGFDSFPITDNYLDESQDPIESNYQSQFAVGDIIEKDGEKFEVSGVSRGFYVLTPLRDKEKTLFVKIKEFLNQKIWPKDKIQS